MHSLSAGAKCINQQARAHCVNFHNKINEVLNMRYIYRTIEFQILGAWDSQISQKAQVTSHQMGFVASQDLY